MSDNAAYIMAEAIASQTRVIAMQLQNKLDEEAGKPISYPPSEFFNEASNLDSLIRDYRW